MKLSKTAGLPLAISLTILLSAVAKADTTETTIITQPGATETIITTPGATETIYEKKSTTVDGVTTTTETTTTKVVPGAEVTTDVFVTTLEGRRLQLEAAIAAGQAAGTITDAQAKAWRAELDAIARAQAEGKSSLTYTAALPLAMSLDTLGDAIRVVSPKLVYVPMISGQRFIVEGGRVIMLDDIMVRRADLESKISRELALGHLTRSQARELRAELEQIADLEASMRAKNGAAGFSVTDSRTLYKMFDKVGSRLDGYRRG